MQKKLDSALKEAEKREITINYAGTLAEAAMKLSGVFKAADDAASLYLENIQRMEREAEELHAEKIKAAQKEADEILLLANRKSAFSVQSSDLHQCYIYFPSFSSGMLTKKGISVKNHQA